jgi:hypothetical protein
MLMRLNKGDRMKRVFLLGVLVAAGCGDDPSTPGGVNLGGSWTATLSDMSGSGVSCSSAGPTTLTINEQNGTFTGSYSGGEMTCSSPVGQVSVPVGTGSILNGTLDGSAVAMDLDTPDFHLTGTISGVNMSGTALRVVDVGPQTVTLNGNWAATR